MKRRDFCSATLLGGAASTLPRISLGASSEGLADIPAVKLSGAATTLKKADLAGLAPRLAGQLIVPGHKDYDTARRIWNPMFDRRPALIVRCANAMDVKAAIDFARAHELLLAVRGGGHSFPGYSTCDGGLVIDLSPMRDVRIDAARRIATVAPGAWVSDVDSNTLKQGLVTTMGQISDTGIAGLTLGGGYGWLSRRHGLACDNLVAADLITADGKLRRVSAQDNADLFWAIRGGGGNFGVVTSFDYRLHEQQAQVYAAYISYPLENLRAVMELYEETTAHGPRELSLDLSIEASDRGDPLVAIYACYSGDPAKGPALIAPFEKVAKQFQGGHGVESYERVQHQSDGPHLSNNLHYLKAGLVTGFKPELIEVLQREFRPSAQVFIYMQNASGAVGDVAPDATAFWNRKSMTNLMIMGSWKNAADTEQHRATIRAGWDKVAPFTQGFYVNLSDGDQQPGTSRAYGSNYPRLAQIKKQYDPRNQFRLNSNVAPA